MTSRQPRSWYDYGTEERVSQPTMDVLEAGTREGFWSILDANGAPIPRTDLPTKQPFIGFYQLKG